VFTAECVTCRGWADRGQREHLADVITRREQLKALLVQKGAEEKAAEACDGVAGILRYEAELLAENRLKDRDEGQAGDPSSSSSSSSSSSAEVLQAYYAGYGAAVPLSR
jgi:hypothetical protein